MSRRKIARDSLMRRLTCWAGVAASSLAVGGVLGCATGENLRPPTAMATISASAADAPPVQSGPPVPPAAPAPLPQEVIPAGPAGQSSPSRLSDGCDPFAGQSELSAQSLATEVELCNPSLGGRPVGMARGRGAISAGDLPRRPDVRLRPESRRRGAGRQWRLDGRGVAEDPLVRQARSCAETPPRRRRTPRRPTLATPD